MILTLLAGAGEYAAWLAMIYAMASDTFGRIIFDVTAWAEAFVEKYGG